MDFRHFFKCDGICICIVGLCLYFTVNVYLQPAEITHLCLYRACGFQRERM